MRLIWILAFLLAIPTAVSADAIVRTQAMNASTIAEIFITEDGIVVELEIGGGDLGAFRNLMPDKVYDSMGFPEIASADRLKAFFEEDFCIVVDEDDTAIIGEVLEVRPRARVRRDEVSGEVLVSPGDPELAVFARVLYPLEHRPERVIFQPAVVPQGRVTVGFVVYHQGVAVNDFRYLTPGYLLTLDWDDPWYSAFDRRTLRRTYWAPMSGFIYVEPFEVRKEIIVRPVDLQRWADIGLVEGEVIPAESQPEILSRVAEFLRTRQKVLIDGQVVTPELARVNFLRRTLRNSTVVDPPEDLLLHPATIGVIFVYPTDGLPRQVSMEWDLFDERITSVPCAAVDQAGPLPSYVSPEDPVLTWTNFLKQPYLPKLQVLERPGSNLLRVISDARFVYAGTFALVAAWLVLQIVRYRRLGPLSIGAAVIVLALIPTVLIVGSRARVTDEQRRDLVGAILDNVYKSFDFRDEERVYDFLTRTVDGDLLDRIYLETRESLKLESQGGARTKVKAVDLMDLETIERQNDGVRVRAEWTVTGSVGHWGHVHQRKNRYAADLTILPVDGEWKLTEVDIIEEERL